MRMIDKQGALRGHGPAPAGYVTCRDAKCRAARGLGGRFAAVPNHYHRVVDVVEAVVVRGPEQVSA